MGYIIHTEHRCGKNNECCGIIINTKVLRKLVKCTLDKSTVYRVNRFTAACGDTRSKSNCCFLGNADVYKLLACNFSCFFIKAKHGRSSGSDGNNVLILFHLIKEIITCDAAVILTVKGKLGLTCFNIKRHTPMPSFFILFCKCETFTLLSHNMNYNRLIGIFYSLKGIDKRLKVVTVLNKNIIKIH